MLHVNPYPGGWRAVGKKVLEGGRMTRFFNIVFMVCLAAVFYVRSETPINAVGSVQAAKGSAEADVELASVDRKDIVSDSSGQDLKVTANAAVAAAELASLQTPVTPQAQSGKLRYVMASDPATMPFTVMAASWQPNAVRAQTVVASAKNDPVAEPTLAIASADVNSGTSSKIETAATSQTAVPAEDETELNTEATVLAEPEISVEPVPTKLWAVSGNVVNARSGPGTNNAVLDQLKRGAIVEDTGERDGDWSRVIVSASGLEVWMHRDFLSDAS